MQALLGCPSADGRKGFLLGVWGFGFRVYTGQLISHTGTLRPGLGDEILSGGYKIVASYAIVCVLAWVPGKLPGAQVCTISQAV